MCLTFSSLQEKVEQTTLPLSAFRRTRQPFFKAVPWSPWHEISERILWGCSYDLEAVSRFLGAHLHGSLSFANHQGVLELSEWLCLEVNDFNFNEFFQESFRMCKCFVAMTPWSMKVSQKIEMCMIIHGMAQYIYKYILTLTFTEIC